MFHVTSSFVISFNIQSSMYFKGLNTAKRCNNVSWLTMGLPQLRPSPTTKDLGDRPWVRWKHRLQLRIAALNLTASVEHPPKGDAEIRVVRNARDSPVKLQGSFTLVLLAPHIWNILDIAVLTEIWVTDPFDLPGFYSVRCFGETITNPLYGGVSRCFRIME